MQAVQVGRFGKFVCSKCRREIVRSSCDTAARRLRWSWRRFCEVCRGKVWATSKHRFRNRWLCPVCLDVMRREHPGARPEDILASLVRQRYLWRRFKSVEQLNAFRLRHEAMRLDMEETLASSEEERRRLKATRRERAEAVLKMLSLHGFDKAK